MLHPSSICFITFILLGRQISKKRVDADNMHEMMHDNFTL
ncbi:hypothetical protein T03_18049 [Trichinella britovi]|uniref:Uncharacterized protein n=1 Tax=Trichinella britovi TaxID=45882 RepID=A0A0V0YXZ8_TRIBR|nr:hypothetical protein T03_18049 [Trichinella britovi]